jgi:hypothetical protein
MGILCFLPLLPGLDTKARRPDSSNEGNQFRSTTYPFSSKKRTRKYIRIRLKGHRGLHELSSTLDTRSSRPYYDTEISLL